MDSQLECARRRHGTGGSLPAHGESGEGAEPQRLRGMCRLAFVAWLLCVRESACVDVFLVSMIYSAVNASSCGERGERRLALSLRRILLRHIRRELLHPERGRCLCNPSVGSLRLDPSAQCRSRRGRCLTRGCCRFCSCRNRGARARRGVQLYLLRLRWCRLSVWCGWIPRRRRAYGYIDVCS
jgi:hypothetical protein